MYHWVVVFFFCTMLPLLCCLPSLMCEVGVGLYVRLCPLCRKYSWPSLLAMALVDVHTEQMASSANQQHYKVLHYKITCSLYNRNPVSSCKGGIYSLCSLCGPTNGYFRYPVEFYYRNYHLCILNVNTYTF